MTTPAIHVVGMLIALNNNSGYFKGAAYILPL
jgi:hypothetical protein